MARLIQVSFLFVAVQFLGANTFRAAEEISRNPVAKESSKDQDVMEQQENCSCTFNDVDPNLRTGFGREMPLKVGKIKKGNRVYLSCKNPYHLLWPNGMRTRISVYFKCDECQKWGSRDLPSCDTSGEGAPYIYYDPITVLPGGAVEVQCGEKLKIECYCYDNEYPQWNYSHLEEPLQITHNINEENGAYLSYLNIPEFSPKHAGIYECSTKAYSGPPAILELRLKGTPRCPSPEISSQSKLVMTPQKGYFYFGEYVNLSCPVGSGLHPDIRRIACFGRKWSEDILPVCRERK